MAAVPVLPSRAVVPTLAFVGAVAYFLSEDAARRGLLVVAATTLLVGTTIYALVLGGTETLRLGPVTLSAGGARAGAAAMSRLLLFLLVARVGMWILPGRELMDLVAYHPTAAYAAGTLLRLVPTLRDDAGRILEAQRARGWDPGRGLRRARNLPPLLVPLFVDTMRRAHEQARALTLAPRPPPDDAPRRRAP